MFNFIEYKVREYFFENSISISEMELSLIIKDITSGCYAFEIIYFTKIGHKSKRDFKKSCVGHKRVDYRELKFKDDLVSIDGGIRYQWSRPSILFIDPREIRERRIEEIIS